MNFFKGVSINNWVLISFQIILLSLLQACSGSQFGKRLTNSFDVPLEEVGTSKSLEDKNVKKIFPDKKNNKSLDKSFPTSELNKPLPVSPINKVETYLTGNKPLKLKPYRIIIKLYGVDPSAPAQIVINSLRDAGLKFEVERIEKFDIDEKFKHSSAR